MKVVLVAYGPLGTRSGGYFYDRMLAQELGSRGHSVQVVPIPPRRGPLNISYNLSSRLLEDLVGASPDILLEDELCHPSLFLMNRRFRRRSPAPIVSIVHHLASSAAPSAGGRARCRALEKRYLASVDAFVFNSGDSREAVSGLMGRAPPGVVACPGRDHTVLGGGAKDLLARPLRLLYIGNILPHKGLDVLVRALALRRDEDVVLEVIGELADRRYFAKVEGLVRKEGLAGRVTFRGYVPNRELDELLERAHVLVVPSIYEGYGIICGEACCHGVPVIASDVGGLKGTVPSGIGFRVPPGDPAALAERIAFLDRHRDELGVLSSSARRHAASLPSWRESMGRAADLLERMAPGGRSSLHGLKP